MNEAILTSIISSACTLIGVIITVVVTNKKARVETEMTLKQQQREIDDIKKKLDTHNDYAVKIPVIERDIQYIRENISDIKKKVGA